jgi:uncharacterized protein YlxW (UPF0749 family)
MALVPLVAVVMVFTIPILGILLAGYKEWLKFKAKHRELGTSTREIEKHLQSLRDRLDRVEQERDALRERVQNLETIVTSEAWIAQHEDPSEIPNLDAAEGDLLTPSPDSEAGAHDDSKHTALIAQRLRDR